ncbi:CBU_0592 family membrane protein [Puia sp.]|jgi:hypothetical protein|uniref:CBU_0592 family membrane protein n=1 Tax=Puia sp. TaxID=2045100 RepID=UPI002F415444
MTITDYTGATGVTLLLIAFFLNLIGRMSKEGGAYLLLNMIGAGLACGASVMLRYWPFIILEGCWTLVSAVGLVRSLVSRA